MKTIAIVNLKGGVGKTITAVNLASLLATEHDKRVLLIDADAQGNATNSLLPDEDYNTLAQLMTGWEPMYVNLVYPSSIRNLDVLPADNELRSLELNGTVSGVQYNLKAIQGLRDVLIEDDAYDYVIIDCPPAFTPPCAAAIIAADSIIIPIKVDKYALDGMRDLTAQIADIRRIDANVRISGCLVTTWYNADAVTQGEALLRQQSPVYVYKTHIRRSPKVDESTWLGVPVVFCSPRSSAAQDIRRFLVEYLAREEGEAV